MLTPDQLSAVVDSAHPLSEPEVLELRARFGRNVLVPERGGFAFVWLLRFFIDPMVLLLIAAGVTYLVLGDRFDAFVALGALVPIFLVTAVLERRSERALEALKRAALPTARVRRGMHDTVIDARDVVPADLMLVQEGDVFVADGILVSGTSLIVDESALTGESAPVVKEPGRGEVFAGTALRSGRGEVVVTATGPVTRYGRIGKLMSEMRIAATPIERVIRRVVWQVGSAVIVLCLAVILIEHGHGERWPASIIAGVSLAMAAIPEELPMVYTLYLALGATESDVVRAAVLACELHPFDPLDEAILRFAASRGVDADVFDRNSVRRYPFDASHRRFTQIWRDGGVFRTAAKGAPEAIVALCALSDGDRARILKQNEALAADGMRVIAVADRTSASLPADRAEAEASMRFLGLLVFSDPVREDAGPAIEACARAGITVIMVTGDHPATAQSTARRLGLRSAGVLTGDQVDNMYDSELVRALADTRVFARIQPEQKLRIVRALHARGDIVAMTGDGTNDALALREADIGVAMGGRGTDVARSAADLVLLDDNFTTIVGAIAGGRRIFRNLRRAFRYLNAFHAPLIISAVAIPFFGVPLLLLPIHLVWLELVVHPTSALVYENDPGGEEDLMTQPPRGRKGGLLRRKDWLRPVALGVVLSAGCLALYIFELRHGEPAAMARGMTLVALVVGQMLLVLTERSTRMPVWNQSYTDNPRLLPILAATFAMLIAALYVPPFANAMRVLPPSLPHFAAALGIAALCTLWLEPLKIFVRPRASI